MAIKIRKKVAAEAPAEEKKIEALEPEVLPPLGKEGDNTQADTESNVVVPAMEDKFLMTSNNVMSWLMEHRRAVGACIAAVLIVAFAWIGANALMEKAAIEESAFMDEAFVTYTALTKAQADELEAARMEYMKSQGIAADAPDILRVTYSVPDDKQRHAVIAKYLEGEIPNHNGEKIGQSAQLMLAGSMAKNMNNAKAEAAYQAAFASESQDVRLFALLGQVEMLIGAKKWDEALSKLDEMMMQNPSFSSYATLEKGRIYEMKGATDEAIKAYHQVLNEFSQPADQQTALARLRYLTADWASHVKQTAPVPSAPVAL